MSVEVVFMNFVPTAPPKKSNSCRFDLMLNSKLTKLYTECRYIWTQMALVSKKDSSKYSLAMICINFKFHQSCQANTLVWWHQWSDSVAEAFPRVWKEKDWMGSLVQSVVWISYFPGATFPWCLQLSMFPLGHFLMEILSEFLVDSRKTSSLKILQHSVTVWHHRVATLGLSRWHHV